MESHTKRFLRIFLFSSATFLQYLQSSSSSSFSGHTPPFLPSHFFIQGSYSGSLVFSALEEKEQESEFVAVNPARRSHRSLLQPLPLLLLLFLLLLTSLAAARTLCRSTQGAYSGDSITRKSGSGRQEYKLFLNLRAPRARVQAFLLFTRASRARVHIFLFFRALRALEYKLFLF